MNLLVFLIIPTILILKIYNIDNCNFLVKSNNIIYTLTLIFIKAIISILLICTLAVRLIVIYRSLEI